MNQLPIEVSPSELRRKLAAGERLHLIDVREPSEFGICRLDGAELLPMRAVPGSLSRLREQAHAATLVLYCHHGVRSLQAARWLRQQGLTDCQSLQGGIDLWSTAVDPAVPRY